MSDAMVIAVAPTGARRTRADHPAIPLTPDEIGRDAAACFEAGAPGDAATPPRPHL